MYLFAQMLFDILCAIFFMLFVFFVNLHSSNHIKQIYIVFLYLHNIIKWIASSFKKNQIRKLCSLDLDSIDPLCHQIKTKDINHWWQQTAMKRKKFKLTVNNSTYINKANNHLSPQLIQHKKTSAYDVGNPYCVLGQSLLL